MGSSLNFHFHPKVTRSNDQPPANDLLLFQPAEGCLQNQIPDPWQSLGSGQILHGEERWGDLHPLGFGPGPPAWGGGTHQAGGTPTSAASHHVLTMYGGMWPQHFEPHTTQNPHKHDSRLVISRNGYI